MAEKGGGRCRCLLRAEEGAGGAGVAPERRRPAASGPAGPARSGAGRPRCAARRAAASTEERRRRRRRQSFGVGGQRRGGGLRSVPERDSRTPPGTVGISFLSLFLPADSSPGRLRAAVPFAFSAEAKLRSRDQAARRQYRLRLITAPCLRACGAGHAHARIYEWPAASVRGVPVLFYAGVWAPGGTRSSQLQRGPGSPVAFRCRAGGCRAGPPRRGPRTAPGGEGRAENCPRCGGEPAERLCQPHRQPYSGGGLGQRTFKGEPCSGEAVGLARRWQA